MFMCVLHGAEFDTAFVLEVDDNRAYLFVPGEKKVYI